MKILFDQGVPVPLRKYLPEHEVSTAFELGWNELSNGELIEAAENATFDVLITTDQNLRHQQNLNDRTIAIVVLMGTSWPKIQVKLDVVSACSRPLNLPAIPRYSSNLKASFLARVPQPPFQPKARLEPLTQPLFPAKLKA